LKRGLPKSILVNKEKVMKYKHVVISRKGGPGVLQVVEGELADPAAADVRLYACPLRANYGGKSVAGQS
jgi:hypothetical protein